MNILGLYLTSVLIWGSTWLAITFQFGTVPPAVSVVYRFALAGLILLAWGRMKGLRLRFSLCEHLWMALQGFLLFGINYLFVYLAEAEITSGLVAVFALVTRQPYLFDWSPRYLLSLAYLAVFGSILAFGAFLVLLGRIGADRAGYVTVAIPIVALLFSALFEGLRWHPSLVLGILLCLGGNVAVLWRRGSS